MSSFTAAVGLMACRREERYTGASPAWWLKPAAPWSRVGGGGGGFWWGRDGGAQAGQGCQQVHMLERRADLDRGQAYKVMQAGGHTRRHASLPKTARTQCRLS